MGASNSVLEDKLGNMTLEDLQTVFDSLATKNSSGERTLSKSAIEKQFPKMASKDLFGKTLFEIFDIDGSGSIDFNEFSVGVLLLTQGTVDKKADALFRILDSNGDNYVDEDELRGFAEKVIGSVKRLSEYLDPDHFKSLAQGGKLATDVDSFLDEAFLFIRDSQSSSSSSSSGGSGDAVVYTTGTSAAPGASAGAHSSSGGGGAGGDVSQSQSFSSSSSSVGLGLSVDNDENAAAALNNNDPETRLLKRAATLTRKEADAVKQAATGAGAKGKDGSAKDGKDDKNGAKGKGGKGGKDGDSKTATESDEKSDGAGAGVSSLLSGPRPKLRMSSLQFRQWASSSPQMHLLIDRTFSINPEQQVCEDVKRDFTQNLAIEIKNKLPMDKAEVCRLHGAISQFWLEIFERRLTLHRQTKDAMQISATPSGSAAAAAAAGAATPMSPPNKKGAAAAASAASASASADKNFLSPTKTSNGVGALRRGSVGRLADEVVDVNSRTWLQHIIECINKSALTLLCSHLYYSLSILICML